MCFLIVLYDMKEKVQDIKEVYGKILQPRVSNSEQNFSKKAQAQNPHVLLSCDILMYHVLIRKYMSSYYLVPNGFLL